MLQRRCSGSYKKFHKSLSYNALEGELALSDCVSLGTSDFGMRKFSSKSPLFEVVSSLLSLSIVEIKLERKYSYC